MTKIVAIGNDHAGPEVKHMLRRILEEQFGYVVTDYGVDDTYSVDYPDIAN